MWALACYASVDGMAVSSDSVLCVGTSIDQSKYDKVSENTPHNLYLSVTPMSDFSEKATTTRKLTNFTGGGKSFAGVKITKINDNRFMISWEEYVSDDNKKNSSANDPLSSSTLHYLFVDGKGKSLSKEFTTAAPISDCQPVVKDSRVVYYASNSNTLNFYSINSDNGKADKKLTISQVTTQPGISKTVSLRSPATDHFLFPQRKTTDTRSLQQTAGFPSPAIPPGKLSKTRSER